MKLNRRCRTRRRSRCIEIRHEISFIDADCAAADADPVYGELSGLHQRVHRGARYCEAFGNFTNCQLQPTAELRPQAASQTDENDLMPYHLLDAIEDQAIGERRSPQEVLDTIAVEFTAYERPQLAIWVRRFFQLWSRNQWKRERYAPSFHVDDKNLDPKTWCRFPILSGGFRRELSELDSIR